MLKCFRKVHIQWRFHNDEYPIMPPYSTLPQAGVTPLRVASAQGHHAVVALLLRAGASPERADKVGLGRRPGRFLTLEGKGLLSMPMLGMEAGVWGSESRMCDVACGGLEEGRGWRRQQAFGFTRCCPLLWGVRR